VNVERYQAGKWYRTDAAYAIEKGESTRHGFYFMLIGNGRHVVVDSSQINITSNPKLYGAKLTKFNRTLKIDEASAVSEEFIKRLFKERLTEI
jgi:hypothetical protein